jgi:hypothetical protein
MSEKIAPVQGYSAGIPWSMHLRAYDAYCKKWGPQEAMIDLEGRNCRGGFHDGELDDLIPGWREEVSEIRRLRNGLNIIAQAGTVHGAAWCVAQAYGYLNDLDFDQYPETGKPQR